MNKLSSLSGIHIKELFLRNTVPSFKYKGLTDLSRKYSPDINSSRFQPPKYNHKKKNSIFLPIDISPRSSQEFQHR